MTIKDKELGPDNKEAGKLMEALHNSINSVRLKINKDIDGWEDEDDSTSSGVGKDIFGKYGFAEMTFKGKTYLMQIRDLKTYEQKTKLFQGMAISGLRQSEALKQLKELN